MIHNVTEVFIHNGGALDANNTSISALTKQLAIVGSDMQALNPAGSDTITTEPSIFVVNKNADGTLKRSFEIPGTGVISYHAESYAPAQREVWAIGYNRKTAAGTITATNSTLYKFTIRFKNDKTFYSSRPEVLSGSFVSSSGATQSNIADQIVTIINGSAFGSTPTGIKEIVAVKVGDGTGAYGLTAATNFGVEIWGLDVNQFQNTTYRENIVYFSVHVDDSTGFDTTTTCTQINAFAYGTGTYNQVYNLENFCYGYEGTRNRRLWPIPTLAYLAVSAPVKTGAYTLTSATTTGSDLVTFSASIAGQFAAGSLIELDGVAYEIKYVVSTTVVILTTVATTTNATGVVKGKAFYDVVNVRVRTSVVSDGAVVTNQAEKVVFIFMPAIVAGGTGNTALTTADQGVTDIEAILNTWMTSTPLAPATVST